MMNMNGHAYKHGRKQCENVSLDEHNNQFERRNSQRERHRQGEVERAFHGYISPSANAAQSVSVPWGVCR